jgi:undecaprenyl-diphosphatase
MNVGSLDYRIFHAIDEFAGDYKWLAHATYVFETVGVVLYAAAVVLLWLATAPGEERRWKIAALSGTASAGLALLMNQVIAQIWHRPRPYETHPQVYHLTKSHDPSFPSDHASAAFGIAFGIYFIDRRIGKFFLAVAVLIGFGRLLVGAHYLSDVLASVVVAAVAAALIVRFGTPLLTRLALLLERVTDPLVTPFHRRARQGSPSN